MFDARRTVGQAARAEIAAATGEKPVVALGRDFSDVTPLRGIVHAAMVLDDAPMALLDRQRLDRVLAPKVTGAWELHRQTQGDALQGGGAGFGLDQMIILAPAKLAFVQFERPGKARQASIERGFERAGQAR